MGRTKKLLIATSVALFLIIILNLVYAKFFQDEKIQAFMVISQIAKGKEVQVEAIQKVYIDNNKESLIELVDTHTNFSDYYTVNAALPGQLITKEMLVLKSEALEKNDGMEYIAIPVDNAADAMTYQLKKGDVVDVYYTAKAKQVSTIVDIAIESPKVYSSNTTESAVSCRLLENIEVSSLYNDAGHEIEESKMKYTQVVIQVTKQMALYLANLKSQGNFTVALVQ